MGIKKILKKGKKLVKKAAKSKTGKEVIRREKVLAADMAKKKAQEIKKKNKK